MYRTDDCRVLVQDGRLIANLGVARTGAPLPASKCVFTTDINVAVAVHVQRFKLHVIRNIDRCLPRDPRIG